ncbi:hypothetical protein ACOMHN_005077 [Nucella lapillus]
MPDPPVVDEKNTILMPSTLPRQQDPRPPGCYKCDATRCTMCSDHLVTSNTFTSQRTDEVFTHRHVFSCTSKNIIYILWCSKCNFTHYVEETKTTLKQRFYKHYADIHRNTGTHVTNHFCQPGHSDSSSDACP